MTLFVSSCTRRQLARRRGGWSRRTLYGNVLPVLMAASGLALAVGAFFAGRGGI